MGLMENDLAVSGVAVVMRRPRLLVDAARVGARIRIERGLAPLDAAALQHAMAAERAHETLRRAASPAYRPARHVEALSLVFAGRARAEPRPDAGAPCPAQTKASGSAAFLRAI
ncbi:DUF6477 family protein [Limibaculum sp. FT325]|uniref:DUF6477 family protein n=1 Tax=Thermohalobaculum sediminis TaxID=2939436 RepID=UPI0020BF6AEC|nr:DUF6477 family protein [Limibaculum sediminis]MCL5778625.1 DUF6477 family protein [Limibaculum sediminis]